MTAQQTSAATSPRVSRDVVAKPSSRFHLGYRPWLDGLRGIAIICVFIQHIQHFLYDREPIIMQFGVLGVDIFFVLSVFLITTLLLEEFQSANTISLTKFYARRGLRLLPPSSCFSLA